MSSWDVFHADSLELERGLSAVAIRAALAGGTLRDDDLVRPAGTTAAWTRLGDLAELSAPAESPAPPTPVEPPSPAPPADPGRRGGPRAASSEGPERIRAGRVNAPQARPAPSDFEFRADQVGETPEPDAPTASTSTAAPPAWIELGGEADDVSFPVIPGPADERGRGDVEPESGESAAWAWVDDEEDEEEALPDDDDDIIDLGESMEILAQDALSVPSPQSRESRAQRLQPCVAAGGPVARLERGSPADRGCRGGRRGLHASRAAAR